MAEPAPSESIAETPSENSPVSETHLRARLVDELEATHVEIVDTSGGCGQSFSALVVSPRFRTLSSLRRHRAVNTALRDEIARIHAWSAVCRTPEEFDAERPNDQDKEEAP